LLEEEEGRYAIRSGCRVLETMAMEIFATHGGGLVIRFMTRSLFQHLLPTYFISAYGQL
jgi:hypothetical protein